MGTMDNEIKELLLAVTQLVSELAKETTSLMDTEAQSLQGPHVREQRERSRRIRETSQQVLALSERVRQAGSQ